MQFKPYLRLDELAYSVPNDYRIVTPSSGKERNTCRKERKTEAEMEDKTGVKSIAIFRLAHMIAPGRQKHSSSPSK